MRATKVYEGSPCANCGCTTRYTVNRHCVECVRDNNSRYRAERARERGAIAPTKCDEKAMRAHAQAFQKLLSMQWGMPS